MQTATATFTVTGTASEPLQSLAITPSTQTILQGQSSQLIAIGTFSSTAATPGTQNLTNSSTVTWASSNNSIATVTAGGANCTPATTNCGGYVKAIGPGAAVLTAIASNPDKSVVTATATITVTATGSGSSEPLVSLAIVPGSQTSLTTGAKANVNFIAIGTTSSGATVNLTTTPYTVPGTSPAETIPVATWSSSNPAVASFASSTGGVATPNGAGATAITAIATNPDGTVVTASAAYTVTPTLTEPIVSLAVLPTTQSSLATGVGANVNFIAIGTTASGATVNLTAAPYTVPGTSPAQTVSMATWTSSNPVVASFASNTGGVATPNASGATAITAIVTNPDGTVVSGSASYTVSVPSIKEPYVSVAIVPASQTLTAVGQTGKFIAIGTTGTGASVDLTNAPGVVWSANSSGVATLVSNGVFKAVANGVTAITVEVPNPGINGNPPDGTLVSATGALTVALAVAPEPLVALSVFPASQSSLTTGAGADVNFIAIGTTSSGATVNLTSTPYTVPGVSPAETIAVATWSSSNPAVAAFATSTGGVATPKGAGATAITAIVTNPDGTEVTGSAVYTVSITNITEPYVSVAIVPAAQTLTAAGQTGSFIAIGTTGTGTTVDLTNAPGVVWSATSSGIASLVSNGVFKAVANGVTAITVEVPNPGINGNPPDGTVVSATGALTVAIPATPEPIVSLAVLPTTQTSLTTGVGANVNFIAIGTTASGASVNLTSKAYTVPGTSPAQTIAVADWSSSNPAVASFAIATGSRHAKCSRSHCRHRHCHQSRWHSGDGQRAIHGNPIRQRTYCLAGRSTGFADVSCHRRRRQCELHRHRHHVIGHYCKPDHSSVHCSGNIARPDRPCGDLEFQQPGSGSFATNTGGVATPKSSWAQPPLRPSSPILTGRS